MPNRPPRLLSRLSCLAIAFALQFALPARAAQNVDPTRELTGETLYQFLLAEIANARGETAIALGAYERLVNRTQNATMARRATEIALFARDFDRAAQMAAQWKAIEPGSREAERILSSAMLSEDLQISRVESHLADLLARDDANREYNLLGLNRTFARISDKAIVLAAIERLTEPYLDEAAAHLVRAQAHAAVEDVDATLASLDEALARRPTWTPAVLFKAQLLRHTGRDEAARTLLDNYLIQRPDDHRARLILSQILIAADETLLARAHLDRVLEHAADDDRETNYAVGQLLAESGDAERAIVLLERALNARHPESLQIRFRLAELEAGLGRVDAALARYQAMFDSEHMLQARAAAANLLREHGRIDEALGLLQDPQADDESQRRLFLAQVQLLRDAGRVDDAFAQIEDGLRQHPDDDEFLYEAAMLAERLDRIDLMENRLRKLMALDPENAHAFNALGYSLADRGLRLDEAQKLIERALEISPDDAYIIDSKGWVRFRKGDIAGALTHLERAWSISKDPEIAAHLGEVLWVLERRDDAEVIWRKGLERDDDNKVLIRTIERLRGKALPDA